MWYPTAESIAADSADEGLTDGESGGFKVPEPSELGVWQWDQYQLEGSTAAKLGLAVASAHVDHKSRYLVAEFSRSQTVPTESGRRRYGVSARLVVRVSNFEAGTNMTLPFVAAEAQFNRLEASAALRVEGYVGPQTGSIFPNFGAFDVESYVKLMDAMTALKNVVGEQEEYIRPAELWVWGDDDEDSSAVDDKLTAALGTVVALDSITRGHPLVRAVSEYNDSNDEIAKQAIRETYSAMGVDDQGAPTPTQGARARELLDGYRARIPIF